MLCILFFKKPPIYHTWCCILCLPFLVYRNTVKSARYDHQDSFHVLKWIWDHQHLSQCRYSSLLFDSDARIKGTLCIQNVGTSNSLWSHHLFIQNIQCLFSKKNMETTVKVICEFSFTGTSTWYLNSQNEVFFLSPSYYDRSWYFDALARELTKSLVYFYVFGTIFFCGGEILRTTHIFSRFQLWKHKNTTNKKDHQYYTKSRNRYWHKGCCLCFTSL